MHFFNKNSPKSWKTRLCKDHPIFKYYCRTSSYIKNTPNKYVRVTHCSLNNLNPEHCKFYLLQNTLKYRFNDMKIYGFKKKAVLIGTALH